MGRRRTSYCDLWPARCQPPILRGRMFNCGATRGAAVSFMPLPLQNRAASSPVSMIKRSMAKRFPAHPKHPERICWGCDRYCAADDLRCGNGSDRTQHPVELWGEDWPGFEPEPSPDTSPAPHETATEPRP